MPRYLELRLVRADVACTALMLEDEAPLTCAAVWDGLTEPLEAAVHHARYSGDELYAPVPSFALVEPPLENPSITPLRGDLMYFFRPAGEFKVDFELGNARGVTNIALWYGPRYGANFLLVEVGFMPGSRFARVVDNLDAFADAAARLFVEGIAGERLRYARSDR